MNNVAAGNFIDEETGEALNDVEKVLDELGISLRDVNGTFRNTGDVLDEVAGRWTKFDNVQQHAIATAMAGTRQQEKFLTLMKHYDTAMQYAETSTNSAGTAMEKFSDYTEGIEAKLNSLKTAFEKLSVTFLNSELITGSVGFVTWLLEALTWLVDKIGGLNTILYATIATVTFAKSGSIAKFLTNIWTGLTNIISSIKIAKQEGVKMGQFISTAFHQITAGATTAQIAVNIFAAAITAVLIGYNLFTQAQDKAIQKSLSSAKSSLEAANAAKENEESLKALIEQYEELAKKNNDGAWNSETAETIKGIQDEIVSLVGDQAKNLDLVNGKLETQRETLKDIVQEYKDGSLADAYLSLERAGAAIQKATNKMPLIGDSRYYNLDDLTRQKFEHYGDIEFESVPTIRGAGIGIKVYFETPEEFVAQYEAVKKFREEISETIDFNDEDEVYYFEEMTEFLEDFEEVYTTYADARDLIDMLSSKGATASKNASSNNNGLIVALKSVHKILEEVQAGYDGLADALANVTEDGYLTADALASLYELESKNALAGLKLKDILTRDANGYKLAEDSLQRYVQALIAQYTITKNFATLQDKLNAIENLKTLQAVLATLVQTQEDAVAADEKQREELEKQQDVYDGQLDAYRELINIRKDLLETYEEELSYQKELAKRQRNVTSLQTKLSVARLDNSAAGQARVRELESELREAQEDLEDFTLEHAIDVLSDQLESQYAEYEAFIKSKLDEITGLLDALKNNTANTDTDMTWAKDALSQIEVLISKIANNEDEPIWESYQDAVNAGYTGIATKNEFERIIPNGPGQSLKEKYGTYANYLEDMYYQYINGGRDHSSVITGAASESEDTKSAKRVLTKGTDYSVFGLGDNWFLTGKDDITVKLNDKEYDVKVSKTKSADTVSDTLNSLYSKGYPGDGRVAMYGDAIYVSNKGSWWRLVEEKTIDLAKAYQKALGGSYETHHTGGFVDNSLGLKSNEEFAKLLKGEFVSTPAQMRHFMENTLPRIANYTATGSSNEFNAPLVEILCQSVTTESLPELERVVNEAVKEIQKQLDSGMSRTGFKRSPTKRLT